MINFLIALKFCTEEYICRVNMAYMVKLGAIKGKYNQIGANKG